MATNTEKWVKNLSTRIHSLRKTSVVEYISGPVVVNCTRHAKWLTNAGLWRRFPLQSIRNVAGCLLTIMASKWLLEWKETQQQLPRENRKAFFRFDDGESGIMIRRGKTPAMAPWCEWWAAGGKREKTPIMGRWPWSQSLREQNRRFEGSCCSEGRSNRRTRRLRWRRRRRRMQPMWTEATNDSNRGRQEEQGE